MQVEVNDVDSHIARPRHADEGIHVCPIHINEPTRLVHNLANLLDVRLKEPERVGIRKHEPGNMAPGAELAQMLEIRQPLRRRANGLN